MLEEWLDRCPFNWELLTTDTLREVDAFSVDCRFFLPSECNKDAMAAVSDVKPTPRTASTISQHIAAGEFRSVVPSPSCPAAGLSNVSPSLSLSLEMEVAPDLPEPQMTPGMRVVHGTVQSASPCGRNFKWAQTVAEIGISFFVCEGLKGRDIAVTFQKRRVCVRNKRTQPETLMFALDPLCDILPGGSTWTLEDGVCVQLLLEKHRKGLFWRCLAEGHSDSEITMPDWWPHSI